MEDKNNLAMDVLRQQQEDHQEECYRLHSIIKGLIIALCIVTALLVGTICYQIYNSYLPTEDEVEQIEQENKDGQNNYIGNNGEINNGKTDDNKKND